MVVRTLAAWCPDWPLVAAGVPAAEPAMVVAGQEVVACSAAARAAGVQRGLRRREAQARCPEATVVGYDPGRDARAFEPVVAAVESVSPRVEVVRPGVCALATRGPSRYFGGDHALAERVAAVVDGAAPGPRCRVGVADGRFAALLAAPRDVVVAPGETASFLAPLPLAVLDRPELVDLLGRLGLRTLGDLAALPTAGVVSRFGPDGALAHRLARGLDDRPLAGRRPPPDLAVVAELDPPVTRVDAAAFTAKSLADELGMRLSDLGLSAPRIRVEVETEHGEHLSRLWRHDGALTPAAMAERVRWQLDGWLSGGAASRPTGGIVLLRLVPDEVGPDRGVAAGFWGTAAASERVARALARLQGMLGPEAVATAVLGGGRGPGEQVRLVPWGEPRQVNASGGPWPGRIPPPAPATTHAARVPAEVVDGDGASVTVSGRGLASAPPARLSIAGGLPVGVRGWAGPWPADERWWDPPAHRRRARWQVATDDGAAHLLTLEGGRWSIEATYD
jgi:protein ImuB